MTIRPPLLLTTSHTFSPINPPLVGRTSISSFEPHRTNNCTQCAQLAQPLGPISASGPTGGGGGLFVDVCVDLFDFPPLVAGAAHFSPHPLSLHPSYLREAERWRMLQKCRSNYGPDIRAAHTCSLVDQLIQASEMLLLARV